MDNDSKRSMVRSMARARYNVAARNFEAKPGADEFKALEDCMYAHQVANSPGITDERWHFLYEQATFSNIIEKLLESVRR